MAPVVPLIVKSWETQRFEGDRAAAIVGAALLDSELEKLLRAFFVDENAVAEQLLRDGGPIGPFATRIHLAYALGLISDTTYLDLKLVNKIRNVFAHSEQRIDLCDPRLASWTSSLKTPEWVGDPDEEDPDSPRGRLNIAIGCLLWHLAAESVRISREGRCKIPEDLFPFGDREGLEFS